MEPFAYMPASGLSRHSTCGFVKLQSCQRASFMWAHRRFTTLVPAILCTIIRLYDYTWFGLGVCKVVIRLCGTYGRMGRRRELDNFSRSCDE
ncbi:hypothetical protein PSPO01_02587 [Paraphaeosphaeria sporulosa]